MFKWIGKPKGTVDLVIDNTGLVIHGEDCWTYHKNGKRKLREKRKLHLGSSNEVIMANVLSEYQKTGGEITPNLINQVGRIDSIPADKVYNQSRVSEAKNDQLQEGGQINIQPRGNAVVSALDEAELRQRMSMSNQSMKTVC